MSEQNQSGTFVPYSLVWDAFIDIRSLVAPEVTGVRDVAADDLRAALEPLAPWLASLEKPESTGRHELDWCGPDGQPRWQAGWGPFEENEFLSERLGMARPPVDPRTGTDCMRCCLATVLGVPYEDVPDFVADHPPGHEAPAIARWLDARGWSAVEVKACGDGELLPSIFGAPGGLWIAGGPAARGRVHAVVYRGTEMIHDPHPSRAGLLCITSATFLGPKVKP